MRRRVSGVVAAVLALGLVAMLGVGAAGASGVNNYVVTKLVSDQAGVARHRDTNLVNAWGLVAGPATPWWVADNGTNVSTLYDGTGARIPLVVAVTGAPTGAVFGGLSDFVVSHNGESGPSFFMFDTESGRIKGWNPDVGNATPSRRAFTVVSRADVGAIYKGLAIASTSAGDRLYATDFHNARVDVFDGNFQLMNTPGAFEDPNIPDGYAPFGIQNLGGDIFVTYAKQDADAEDDVAGPHLGFVDMYDTSGNLLGRVASRGALDAPWGLAWAPADFGAFGGDLLVGNFGDGRIHAYAPSAGGTFSFAGTLRSHGSAIAIDGLWALQFGNDGPAGPSDRLFFTAGPDDESHGLFGRIRAGS